MNNTDRHPECHMRTALGNCDPIGGFCTSVNEFICEALHKVSRPQGEWIPCEERLPEKNGDYIVSLEDAVYPWATFFNGKWFMLSVDSQVREFGGYEVFAWMPLPQPWKGADDE